jgi:hypothetical protein
MVKIDSFNNPYKMVDLCSAKLRLIALMDAFNHSNKLFGKR